MEHIQLVNGLKFTSNMVCGQAINGNSLLTLTKSSTAPELTIPFLELRTVNTNNKETKELLNIILDEITDADDLIDELLINLIFLPKLSPHLNPFLWTTGLKHLSIKFGNMLYTNN